MSRLLTLLSGALGGGAALSFQEQILALPGLIAYWPLSETSGTTADNAEGTATRDGTYSNIALNSGTLVGTPAPQFNGNNSRMRANNAEVLSAFNGQEGSWFVFGKTSSWTGAIRIVFEIDSDGSNRIRFVNNSYVIATYVAGGVTKNTAISFYPVTDRTFMFGLTWSKTNDQFKTYWNGAELGSTVTGLGTWAGVPAAIDVGRSSLSWNGLMAHAFISALPVSSAAISALWYTAIQNDVGVFFVGDSKTNGEHEGTEVWGSYLLNELTTATSNEHQISPKPYAWGGYNTAQMKTYFDNNFNGITGNTPSIACINLGANDVVSLPAEATWKANYTAIIDYIRVKWPTCQIYLAKVWRRTYGTECDALAGWIDDIAANYASGVYVGMDERIWLENGDDGATYTSDGIHYNVAAQTVCADAWLTGITS